MQTMTFLAVLVAAVAIRAEPAEKARVAVQDLRAQGIEASTGAIISDRLRNELFKTGVFSVLERSQMEELLKEQGFQQSGCTSDACVVEVGQLLGVQYMVLGGVGKVGSTYTLNARIIDVRTGEIKHAADADCKCPVDEVLSGSTPRLAAKLAGAISGKPVAVSPQSPTIQAAPRERREAPPNAEPAPVLDEGQAILRGREYYTRFTFRTIKNVWNATNYGQGDLVPINTHVKILGVGRDKIAFCPVGTRRKIVVINVPKYTRKSTKQLAQLMFSPNAADLSALAPETAESVQRGETKLGMTKKEVLMARGIPPAHKTPSFDTDTWIFWESRYAQRTLRFVDGRLAEGRGLQ